MATSYTAPVSAGLLILKVGLVAGTLDICDALIYSGFHGALPHQVFWFIAAGLIGARAAVEGGMATAALGLGLHYGIVFIWTALYYAASRSLPVLRRWPVPCGLAYGLLVYLVMNLVVLPLSRIGWRPLPHGFALVNAVGAVMLFIGLTIAVLMRRWDPLPASAQAAGAATGS
ncbi:MAG: hypothetical protein ACRD1L_07315 [Terriglobales bacterium]